MAASGLLARLLRERESACGFTLNGLLTNCQRHLQCKVVSSAILPPILMQLFLETWQGLPYVINLTLPDRSEDYIHRVGRVGRADTMGLAISLVSTMPEKVGRNRSYICLFCTLCFAFAIHCAVPGCSARRYG